MRKSQTNRKSGLTRREFIGAAASIAAFTIVPRHVLGGPGFAAPSDKLNIAGVGAGGHGAFLFNGMIDENTNAVNLVALCDVDEKHASATIQRPIPRVVNVGACKAFPKATKYKDFRKMLEKERETIDAVVVCTPDHTHIPISVMAMKMGKHVYCEKPLGQNIHEIRVATKVARECGVATQMGIGNHSSETFRRVVETIRSGAIGEVREVHVWCDNEWEDPPRVVADWYNPAKADQLPPGESPVPESLAWDLWLGPARVRPYHRAYHPMHWRDWWDFGNGRLGDIGCHCIDLVFWALNLKYPLTVQAEGPGRAGRERTPPWLIAQWTFPARGNLPPVSLTWCHGNKRPEQFKEANLPHDWPVAVLFVGSEGMLITQIEVVPPRFELHPKERFADFTPPPRTIPRSIGHYREWIVACKTGSPTSCGFDYSGPLTETVLLGNVAYRAGEKLRWDPESLKATNCPDADEFISREYREGWTL